MLHLSVQQITLLDTDNRLSDLAACVSSLGLDSIMSSLDKNAIAFMLINNRQLVRLSVEACFSGLLDQSTF